MQHFIKQFVFRQVDGIWRDTAGDGEVLADVLDKFMIIVDDRTLFARLYDYGMGVSFWYRAYSGKIVLTLWRIE